jgi:hypothetical protein
LGTAFVGVSTSIIRAANKTHFKKTEENFGTNFGTIFNNKMPIYRMYASIIYRELNCAPNSVKIVLYFFLKIHGASLNKKLFFPDFRSVIITRVFFMVKIYKKKCRCTLKYYKLKLIIHYV